MAELRCPMCGNVVSSGLEICPHCQARLKPLTAASSQPVQDLNPASDQDRSAQPAGPASQESDVPDWLQELRGDPGMQKMESEAPQEGFEAEPTLPEDMPAPGPEQDLKDWLSNLEGEDQGQTSEEIKPEPVEGVIPTESDAGQEQGMDAGDADSWLGRLRMDQPDTAPAADETVNVNGPNSEEDSLPQTPSVAESEPEQSIPARGQDEIPEWLLRLQAETHENAALEPESNGEGVGEKFTDPPTSGAMPAAGDKADEALPHIQGPEITEELLTGDQGLDADADKPDWQKESSLDIPALSEELEPLPEEKLDWVQFDQTSDTTINHNMTDGGISPGPTPGEDALDQRLSAVTDRTDVSAEPVSGEELQPDWLQDVDAGAVEPAPQEPTAVLDEGLTVPPVSADEPLPGVAELETPDWVASLGQEGNAPAEDPSEEDAASLEEAQIPAWVQDMKPLDALVDGQNLLGGNLAGVVETEGPLAGLKGVLPSSPGLGKPRKPLNYSTKLRVSDEQTQQVADLEKMISGGTPLTSPAVPGSRSVKGILRWVLSLVLIVAILVPAVSGFSLSPAPQNYPPELVAAREVLFGLPKESAVLLVFAYQPAYASELEAAGLPLVGNLLSTGARLAAVSTLPTGPALVENFLTQAERSLPLPNASQTTNLGYLAGGASGVLKFAMDPVSTLPNSLSGCQPWTCLLKGIKNLSDFGAVVVMTDDPDQARTWIEQAAPYLGDKPLVMVISAQAEPLVRPYYESGQVKGLVTGLAGGKAYEQALQIPGLSSQYWDAFSMAMVVAESALVIGGIWSLVAGLLKRRSTERGQA